MDLNFKAYGAGQPVVLLHGLFGSLDNWHRISVQLAQHFHVFAVDQRNHGGSPHAREMSYPLMAADLEEFMDVQHLESAFVLGHSMGGKTAMQFALLHPQRVSKLVIVDIGPRAYSPRHSDILEAMLGLKPENFQTRKEMEEKLAPAIPELPLRQFLLKSVTRNHEGRFQWKLGLEEIAAQYPKLSQAVTGPPFIKPTLFLRGEHSDYLQEHDLKEIRKLFPLANLKTIHNAGHLVHVENPQLFLQEILSFFGEGAEGTSPG